MILTMKNFKTFLFLLTLFSLISTNSYAQKWGPGIKGEGPVVTKDLNVSGFHGVSLGFSGDVYLKQGSSHAVSVEGQANIIENIKTEVSGGIWRINFKRNVRNYQGLKIYITMPRLTMAKVSGSGNINTQGHFNNIDDLELGVSGSGNITMDADANNIDSRISGSGDIQVAGKTVGHSISISGSGDVFAYNLKSTKCSIRISGSGNCQVDVIESLDVSISGSGNVTYQGRPRVKSKASGSGSVQSRG